MLNSASVTWNVWFSCGDVGEQMDQQANHRRNWKEASSFWVNLYYTPVNMWYDKESPSTFLSIINWALPRHV